MKANKKRKTPPSPNLPVEMYPTERKEEKSYDISQMMTLIKEAPDKCILFDDCLEQAIGFFQNDKISSCLEILENLKLLLNPDKDFAYLINFNVWHLICLIKMIELNNESNGNEVESILTQLSKQFTLFFRHYHSPDENNQVQLEQIFDDLIYLQKVNFSQTDPIDLYHLLFNQVAEEMLKIDYFLGFTFNILISKSHKKSKGDLEETSALSKLLEQNNRNFSFLNHQPIMDFLIKRLFKQTTYTPAFKELICNHILAIINDLNKISDTQKAFLYSFGIMFIDTHIPEVIEKCQIVINLFNQIIQSKQDPIPPVSLKKIISFILFKLDSLDPSNFGHFHQNFSNIKMELRVLNFQFSNAQSNFIYISDLLSKKNFRELKYLFTRTVNLGKVLEITRKLIPTLWALINDSSNPDSFFYLKYFILLKMNLYNVTDCPEFKEALSLVIPSQYKKLEIEICSSIQKQRDLIFYINSNLLFLGTHTISTTKSTFIPESIRPSIAIFSVDNESFQDLPFSMLEKISNPNKYIPSHFSYPTVAIIASHYFAIHYIGGPLDNRSMNQLKNLINTHIMATFKNPICLNKSFRFALYQAFINMALAGKYPNTFRIKESIQEVKEKDDLINQTMCHLSNQIGNLLSKNTGLQQLDLYIYKLSLELSIVWINSCKGLSIEVLIKKLQFTAERIAERIIALSDDPTHSGQNQSVSKMDYGHVSLFNFNLYKRISTTDSENKSEIKAYPITMRGEDLIACLLETPPVSENLFQHHF